MTNKKQFISNWLKDNPNDDEYDAMFPVEEGDY
jgi:hypothetical protein